MHLREDRRHIKDDDVFLVKNIISTRLNFEMACTDEMMKIALQLNPYSICLVPEKRLEQTTERGLNFSNDTGFLANCIKQLVSSGTVVSLFIDPDFTSVHCAAQLGANCVEFHSGLYANAFLQNDYDKELQDLYKATELAHNLGLDVQYRSWY